MTGDPVAARLPYAILTKIVTFTGWKRFEMNETLKFNGETESAFPSNMRRSLRDQLEGKVHQRGAPCTPLAGTQGYFLMYEDMKDFVTSKARGRFFVHNDLK